MKIGFVNIYSFRPHVEHLAYLANLCSSSGHEVFYLTCDAAVSDCYVRSIRTTKKIVECPKCILGGVRSFSNKGITSIKSQKSDISVQSLDRLVFSSACTLARTESNEEASNDPLVKEVRRKLYDPTAAAYESARQWILDNELEAVIIFNGRMELTAAIMEACNVVKIPFITHERTWFGDGLRLIPNNNCLSIEAICDMVKDYDNKPLTLLQAKLAGKVIGERFLQRNSLEWRLYNKNPEPVSWPLAAKGKRVLVLPSSRNEFAGHQEWVSEWKDNTSALDDFLDVCKISPEQVVIRAHPNWAENIGKVKGNRSSQHYIDWAKKRDIFLIDAAEKANTYDLIQQADIVILNGGSSAIEAGACGKQVVCLGSAPYQNAGFVETFKSRGELEERGLKEIDQDMIRRKTLRYIYLRSHRFPQFVDYVKAIETTRYQYLQGAESDRLINMILTGKVQASDSAYCSNVDEEFSIVKLLEDKQWGLLAGHQIEILPLPKLNVQRRFGFRWLDIIRAKFPRGDR